VKLHYYLKLEFITSDDKTFDVLPEQKKHYQTTQTSLNEIEASNFDCQIPIHLFGSSNGGNIFGGPHIYVQ
jgi:hypothetical protein